jgi:hypothetical protein
MCPVFVAKAEFSQRISAIIEKEFSTELANREEDIHEIQKRLHQAQKTLHLLRYAIVSAFYNKKQVQVCNVSLFPSSLFPNEVVPSLN